ncbi:hypothetical protein [Qipengyuania sp. RANM35]|uniref:hypothetical protein n=1 Tax=Qipengyuania sp. RANM35 TaxID=3068635 RepID=UPI0034DAFF02
MNDYSGDEVAPMLENAPTLASRGYYALTTICPAVLTDVDMGAINQELGAMGFTDNPQIEHVPDLGNLRSVEAKLNDGIAKLGITDDRKFCAVMMGGDGAENAFKGIRDFIPFVLEGTRTDSQLAEHAKQQGSDLTRYVTPLENDSYYVLDFIDDRAVKPTSNLVVHARILTASDGN